MGWRRSTARRSTSRFRPSRWTARTRRGRSIDLWIGDIRRLERVGRAAKLAGDRDLAVLDHVVAVRLREGAEHRLHGLARARALRMHLGATKHPHATLME